MPTIFYSKEGFKISERLKNSEIDTKLDSEKKIERCVQLEKYTVFHRFGQAKFANGYLILSSSQNLLQLQRPLKTWLVIKVVKLGPKVIISLPWFKSVKQTIDIRIFREREIDKDIVKVQFNQSWIFARWIIKAGILIWELNQNGMKVSDSSQGLNPINNKLVWIRKNAFTKKTVRHSKSHMESSSKTKYENVEWILIYNPWKT
jgi:hypothetical protein